MSDQCRACNLNGNFSECQKSDCTYHDLWYSKYLRNHIENLQEALGLTLEWIDTVPQDTILPTMPGFDRDWVDEIKNEVIY